MLIGSTVHEARNTILLDRDPHLLKGRFKGRVVIGSSAILLECDPYLF